MDDNKGTLARITKESQDKQRRRKEKKERQKTKKAYLKIRREELKKDEFGYIIATAEWLVNRAEKWSLQVRKEYGHMSPERKMQKNEAVIRALRDIIVPKKRAEDSLICIWITSNGELVIGQTELTTDERETTKRQWKVYKISRFVNPWWGIDYGCEVYINPTTKRVYANVGGKTAPKYQYSRYREIFS